MAVHSFEFEVATDETILAEDLTRKAVDILAEDGAIKVNFGEAATTAVAATGSALLAGGSGSIDSITVGGVEILSGAVPFNTDINTTAEDVKDNIVAHGVYSATRSGATVTIIALVPSDAEESENGKEVVTTGTTLTSTDTDMSGGVNDSYWPIASGASKRFEGPLAKRAIHALGTATKKVVVFIEE